VCGLYLGPTLILLAVSADKEEVVTKGLALGMTNKRICLLSWR
jgi:hypothetical protein